MARSDTLPIFLDTYKLTLEIYQVTAGFSHDFKYSLGQDMKRDTLNLLRCIFSANHHKDKAPFLDEFLSVFEQIRIELRLCYDLKVISLKKNVHLNLIMESIAKQANAWRKHEKIRYEQNDG